MYAPLTIVILDLLKKSRRKVISDKDLYRKLVSLYSKEKISKKDFIKALMVLEVKRMIHVEYVKKNTRLIYLLNENR